MKTISNSDDLADNLATLYRYLQSRNEGERSFAQDLVRSGLCFVVQTVEGKQFFAPSRFVGYGKNNMDKHRRNKGKDGRDTSLSINEILGAEPTHDSKIEQQYLRFCERIGVKPGAKGPFGIERKYWVLQANAEVNPTLDKVAKDFNDEVSRSIKDSPEARHARLGAAPKKPKRVPVSTFAFLRNPDVVAEVLLRARGECEGCHQQAPFVRRSDGSPYLEVHHMKQLADDGDDTVDNARTLCPNCHRKSHYA